MKNEAHKIKLIQLIKKLNLIKFKVKFVSDK